MQKELQNIILPPGCPEWITRELLAETIKVWQPHYDKILTSSDAMEILTAIGEYSTWIMC